MTWPSFVCPRCGAESFNPNDIANNYCGACHAVTAADIPSEAYAAGLCPACLGHGTVNKVVPHEHVGPCSACGGVGTLQAMWDHLEENR